MNTLLPSVLINYLSVSTFLIPCGCGDKTGFGVTTFLAQTVNLMSISQYIPEGGKSLPVFQKYLLASICFIVVITLINIHLTVIHNSNTPEKVVRSQPWAFLLKHLNPIVGPKVTMPTTTNYHLNEDDFNEKSTASAKLTDEANNEYSIRQGVNREEDVQENTGEKLDAVCATANRLYLVVCFLLLTISTVLFLSILILNL